MFNILYLFVPFDNDNYISTNKSLSFALIITTDRVQCCLTEWLDALVPARSTALHVSLAVGVVVTQDVTRVVVVLEHLLQRGYCGHGIGWAHARLVHYTQKTETQVSQTANS